MVQQARHKAAKVPTDFYWKIRTPVFQRGRNDFHQEHPEMTSMRLRARAWRLGPTGRGRDEERKAKALKEHQDGEFGGHSFPSVLGGGAERKLPCLKTWVLERMLQIRLEPD